MCLDSVILAAKSVKKIKIKFTILRNIFKRSKLTSLPYVREPWCKSTC